MTLAARDRVPCSRAQRAMRLAPSANLKSCSEKSSRSVCRRAESRNARSKKPSSTPSASTAIATPKVHGGPRQAVLIITAEAIEELKALGYPLYPGALGENLTTEGIDRAKVRVGQHYRAGDAILEITKLRQPCKTLLVYGDGIQQAVYDEKVKAGDHSSTRWGLAGFYATVIEPGRISAGAPIMLIGEPA